MGKNENKDNGSRLSTSISTEQWIKEHRQKSDRWIASQQDTRGKKK